MAIHLEFGNATILVSDVATGDYRTLVHLRQVTIADPTDFLHQNEVVPGTFFITSEKHVVSLHDSAGIFDQWDVREIDDGTTYPTTADLIDAIKTALDNMGGGGGGITSVNGDSGPAVVLDAADVGADPAGSAATAQANAIAAAAAMHGLQFTFSTTTTDSDPGSGNFRFNHATFGSITQVFIDNVDANGNDVSGLVAQWSNAGLLFFKQIGGTGEIAFALGAIAGGIGYVKFALTNLGVGAVPANGTIWQIMSLPMGLNAAVTAALLDKQTQIDGKLAINGTPVGGYRLDARNGTTDLVGVVVFDLSAYSAIQFVSAMAVGTSTAFPGTILDPTLATYTLRFLDLAGVPLVAEPVVFTFLGLPV